MDASTASTYMDSYRYSVLEFGNATYVDSYMNSVLEFTEKTGILRFCYDLVTGNAWTPVLLLLTWIPAGIQYWNLDRIHYRIEVSMDWFVSCMVINLI